MATLPLAVAKNRRTVQLTLVKYPTLPKMFQYQFSALRRSVAPFTSFTPEQPSSCPVPLARISGPSLYYALRITNLL